MSAAPLWSRALAERAEVTASKEYRTLRSRLALQAVLARAGHRVSLVTLGIWPRHEQGRAYLWAIAFLQGREDLPAPEHVIAGSEGGRRR